MGVRGMDQLAELRSRIRALGSAGFKVELSQVLGAASMKLVADEFQGSHDPYGDPWASLRSRDGKPLLDTGRMRNSVAIEQTGAGFRVYVTARYSPTHQRGATILPKTGMYLRFRSRNGAWHTLRQAVIPRRQMLPERSTGGLGPVWIAAYNREAASLMRRRLSRAA